MWHVLSVVPQTVDKFEEGVKTDPTDVLGIWMGLDYLNMTLIVKENGEHKFHFIEDEVIVDTATGCSEVYLTLYHDAKEEVGDPLLAHDFGSHVLRRGDRVGQRMHVTAQHLAQHRRPGGLGLLLFYGSRAPIR